MKFTPAVITLYCGIALFAACKKTDDTDNKNNNTSAARQALEAGKWQMIAGTATINYMGKDTSIDIYSQMDECDKDDFMQFAADGKATMDENTNKCPDDAQVETATYALLNNDTKLAIVDSNPDTFDLEISTTQMKLKITKPNTSGTPVTTIQTYKNIK